jgi:hypothetical protein
MRRGLALLIGIALVGATAAAHADQPRDYMLDRSPTGDFLLMDYFGTGGRLTLQHRSQIYGAANDATIGTSTLVSYALGQSEVFAQLRVLFLEVGGNLGYRATWRNLSFAPGAHGEYCSMCDSAARRARDPVFGMGPDTDRFGYAEAHAQLYAPFNDYIVFTSLVAARLEDCKPRSYDWFYADIHDAGVAGRFENMLLFKHRNWGGIGPYLQAMFLPRAGVHQTEWAFGFNAVTRLGLVKRDDLLFLTFLMRPGDAYYGQHAYYSPVRALLIYRMTLTL